MESGERRGTYRLRLKDIALADRPQERLERLGAEGLSDMELLAMLLRKGSRAHDVMSLSSQLLAEAGSLQKLLSWDLEDFTALDGIGKIKGLQLLAVMELARRVLKAPAGDGPPVLDEPEKVFLHLYPKMAGWTVERFYICALNRKNRLIRDIEITSGTATSSLVHPREVFRAAVQCQATAIIAAHNHPSGDPAPSAADIQVTKKLQSAAQTIEIDLLDHIIIGSPQFDPASRGYYSFSESGLL